MRETDKTGGEVPDVGSPDKNAMRDNSEEKKKHKPVTNSERKALQESLRATLTEYKNSNKQRNTGANKLSSN
jgi:hypothetical protein